MAGVLQHLRSSTLDKRPNPASMVDGQVAINYASGAPGMFFKDSNGSLVKVGPVHVGSGAPNASPASGGTAGNSLGEQWLDTSGGTYVFKVWDGSAWRSEAGEFVNVTGDTMTGALGIIAGSASTPGLFFSGDANSGLYSPGADQVAISTNAVERLRIDSNGDLLSGTTGSLGYGGRNIILKSGQGYAGIASLTTESRFFSTWDSSAIPMTFYQGGSERMRLDSSGRLGLGSSNPLATNHIRGSGTSGQVTASWLLENASSGTVGMDVTGAPGSSIWRFLYGGGPSTGTNALTPAITIGVEGSAAGRVGIGTTTVSEALHLKASSPRFRLEDADGGYVNLEADNGNLGIFADNGNTQANSFIRFDIDGTEKSRLTSSGQWLVGTSSARSVGGQSHLVQFESANSSPFSGLSIVGNSNDSNGSYLILGKSRGTSAGSNTVIQNNDQIGGIFFAAADGNGINGSAGRITCEIDGTPGANDLPGRLVFSTCSDGSASPSERCRIDSAGRLLIGQTSGSGYGNRLAVSGTATVATFKNESSTGGTAQTTIQFLDAFDGSRGSISVNTSGTNYNTTSDYRAKENVVPLTGAIDRLKLIPVHRFNFISDPSKTVDGFIAHEAQTVVPECVTGEKDAVDDEGNPVYQGIDQSKLVPLLTAALQEAIGLIETLEAEVAALKA